MIIARSQIKRRKKKIKSMEIKKLNRKEKSDLRDVLKNSCSKNLISLLETIKMFCSENCKKNIRGIFRIMSNSYVELFHENSEWLKDINYFCKKNFFIDVRRGPKFASENYFF